MDGGDQAFLSRGLKPSFFSGGFDFDVFDGDKNKQEEVR